MERTARFDGTTRVVRRVGVTPSSRVLAAVVVTLFVAALGLWTKTVQTVYVNEGAFVWLGVDFRAYFTQALSLRIGTVGDLYDLRVADEYARLFDGFAHVPWPLTAAPVPYPPLFAGLFEPFTLFPPLVSFALWTAVNLLVAVYLAWRMAAAYPGHAGWRVGLLFLVSFPVGYSLFLGQPMIFLAVAAGESFLALAAERDLAAGLWLGVLLIKPQYGLLIGPLLIWKRRWWAVTGVATTGLVILVGSLVVAGLPGLLAYPRSMLDEQVAIGSTLISYPQDMTNWRMVFFLAQRLVFPDLGGDIQFALTMLFSGLTAAVVLVAWRGPWAPRDPSFAARMTLLWVGTVLATYHSHAYGPVLAALPAAVMLASAKRPYLLGGAVLDVTIVPTTLMLVLRPWFLPILTLQLMLVFGAIAVELRLIGFSAVAARVLPRFAPGRSHLVPITAEEAKMR
jgi:hypothetical protein